MNSENPCLFRVFTVFKFADVKALYEIFLYEILKKEFFTEECWLRLHMAEHGCCLFPHSIGVAYLSGCPLVEPFKGMQVARSSPVPVIPRPLYHTILVILQEDTDSGYREGI